jgi:hypothetical protein
VRVVTIESAIKECDSHVSRIARAKGLLEDKFPLSQEGFLRLGDEVIEHLDQLIYRFGRLQDSMGTRLLPSLYAHVDSNDAPQPFLVVLARLEQLDIVTSAEDWQFFRNLRNNLTHDYPESVGQTVSTLNTLYQDLPKLVTLYLRAREYWRSLRK